MDRYRYWKAEQLLKNETTPVIVYTMAKVASSSIFHSIEMQSDLPVFHIHSLDIEKIQEAELNCKKNGLLPDSRTTGALIYEHKIKSNKAVKIITCVREPIARNLSAFFEVFEYYMGLVPQKWKGNSTDLMQTFFEKLPHQYPVLWFDDEFKRMTQLDVYNTPFDFEKKYQFYQKENIEVLLLRTDLEDGKKEELIGQFLDIPQFKLGAYNVGSKKDYAHLYDTFKKQIELPTTYLEQMLGSKYCQHFFSEQEIAKVYSDWK